MDMTVDDLQRVAGLGVWTACLPDGRMDWCPRARAMLGLDGNAPETFAAWVEWCHPDDRPDLEGALAAAPGAAVPLEVDHRFAATADGRWLRHCLAVTGRSPDGVITLAGTVQDITRRKLASLDLRSRLERLEVATRAGGVGVWDWDVVPDVLVWDESMYRLYGLLSTSFGGAYEAWSSAIHPDDRVATEAAIQAALRGEREYAPRFRVVWPDGSVHHIQAASRTYFDARGVAVRMTGVNYDLTAQVAVEEALVAAKAAADAASRAKTAFLANVSHEIRTPMNAVIGLSALGLGIPDLPPRVADYLGRIQASSQALLFTINDILDYAKLDSQKLELERVEFELEPMIDNVIDLFGLVAYEKGVELLLQVDPRLPLSVIGDSLRLGQILSNLVGNAVKFTSAGHVCLSVARLSPDPLVDGGTVRLRIAVQDTGIGIAASDLAGLFQPFTQADGSIARRFGGTGLGLVISMRLVEAMGGVLEVQSEPGKGSTFSFVLELPVGRVGPARRSDVTLRGVRTLLAGDVTGSRQVVRELLESWGVLVTEVSTVDEAITLMERARRGEDPAFGLVLLDWALPEPGGVGLARWLQKNATAGALPHAPVVAMVTTVDRAQVLADAEACGLDSVLQKPVTASRLLDAISGMNMPAQLRSPDPLRGLRERARPIEGARVLVVEDLVTNQVVARDLLERLGLNVTVAGDGHQALEILERESFDVVLMDLQMPVLDGFETTRRIRRRRDLDALPVLAMTAAALPGDRVASEAAGMNGHVAKPIDPTALLDALLAWVPARHAGSVAPAPPAVARFVARFPDIAGIDAADARRRLGGNLSLYLSLLVQARRTAEDVVAAALRAHEAGDHGEAERWVHALRGLLGNLGARRALETATHLEATVRERRLDAAGKGFATLQAQVTELVRAIGEHLRASPDPAGPDSPGPVDAEALAELIERLQASDAAALDQYEALRPALRAQMGEVFSRALDDAFEQLKFVDAARLLRSVSEGG